MDSRRGTRSVGLVFAAVLLLGAGTARADESSEAKKKAAASEQKKATAKKAAPAPKAESGKAAEPAEVPAPPPVVERKIDPLDAALMQAMATTSAPTNTKKATKTSPVRSRAEQRARKSGGLKGLAKFTKSARKASLDGRHRSQVPDADHVVRMDVQPLPPAAVSAVIKKNAAKVSYCHERLAARGLASGGEVSVNFVVEPKGNVSNVKIVAGGKGARELERCMKQSILEWKFPAADAPTDVHYPFVFKGGGAPLSN